MEDTRGTVKKCVIIERFGREREEGVDKKERGSLQLPSVCTLRSLFGVRFPFTIGAFLKGLIEHVSNL